jgi:fatty acid desaturase
VAAVILGFGMAEVGVCIQHDANHGAFSKYAHFSSTTPLPYRNCCASEPPSLVLPLSALPLARGDCTVRCSLRPGVCLCTACPLPPHVSRCCGDTTNQPTCSNSMLCYAAGLSLDAVGASSFMWKQQHVVGHHAYTNVLDVDPDIRVSLTGGDVRRVVPKHPKGPHHRFQHLYLGFLYSLLAAKSIFLDDFSALSSGKIGSVKVNAFAVHEAVTFWVGKALFVAWFLIAPLSYTQWSLRQLLLLWGAALAVCGWTLAFMFQV